MFSKWILVAFMGTLISSFTTIFIKFIGNSKYDNIIFILLSFVLMGFISLIYLLFNKNYLNKLKENLDCSLIILALLFSLVLISTKLIFFNAFSISPNISYTHIIINLNIIFTILASYFLFEQKINYQCFIGILLCIIGIMIIAKFHKM